MRAWGPAVGWALVLFSLSALPDLNLGVSFPASDKAGHLVLYAVLGAALAHGQARMPGSMEHWVLLLIGALYGLSDEWHQLYVPGRSADLRDWIADLIGLVIGYGMAAAWFGRANSRDDVDLEE